MNYQVILNDQVNIIISNVEYIEIKNEFVSFHDEKGNYVAGFKLEGITGFFTMDKPELEWPEEFKEPLGDSKIKIDMPIDVKGFSDNFKKIAENLNKRFNKKPEAWELIQSGTIRTDKPPENWEKEAQKDFNVQMNEIYRKAKNAFRSGTIIAQDIHEQLGEVEEEARRRGTIAPHVHPLHLYTRKLIKDKLQRMKGLRKNDKYHFIWERFEEVLAKNMEECLYDDYVQSDEKEAEELREGRKRQAVATFKKELNKAARILKDNIYTYGDISPEINEIGAEALERGTYIKGGDIYAFERKLLKEALKDNMEKAVNGSNENENR